MRFTGFRDDDQVLNALAGLLGHHWDRLVSTQREVVTALRHHEGLKKDAAKELGISQQSLSNRAQSAGAREYAAGMDAWRAVLRRHEPRVAR